MKIQNVEIRNFKCLTEKNVSLKGNNVYLVAPNCKGKTSFIDACFGVMPSEPLKQGARSGKVNVDVGDYQVEFRFSEKSQKPRLNIFDKNGEPQKSPAKLFKEIFGVKDFNIDEFLGLSNQKQIDFIKEIIGIDWSDLEDEYKRIFDERTYLKRQVKEVDAVIENFFYDPDLEEIDITDLREKLNKARTQNENINKVKSGIESKEEQIAKIDEQLKALIEDKKQLHADVSAGENWLKGKELIDTQSLDDELTKALDNNSKVVANDKVGKDREKSQELWDKIEEADLKLAEIQKAKKDELANAEMPVKGLTFDDNQLYLDGFPFKGDQINTARRIVAGLEIQFALMSDVKIARFDGSLLDKNSMAEVEQWAKDKGVQLFVEFVDRDGEELKVEVKEV